MIVTIDQVMNAFIKTRDEIAAKTKIFNESLANDKAKQVAREKWMLGQLNTQNVKSIATDHGTCFAKYAESVTVSDGDVFLDWVHADWENRRHFLTNACAKGAVKQALDDGETVPSGVSHTKVKIVQIRKK